MTFEIEFDDLPLTFDGVSAGLFWGVATFDAKGNCLSIDLHDDHARTLITLVENDARPDSRVMFRALKTSILRRYAGPILDEISDIALTRRSDALADAGMNSRREI